MVSGMLKSYFFSGLLNYCTLVSLCVLAQPVCAIIVSGMLVYYFPLCAIIVSGMLDSCICAGLFKGCCVCSAEILIEIQIVL